jgi:thiol-disulfide isomerase/thioredoxin
VNPRRRTLLRSGLMLAGGVGAAAAPLSASAAEPSTPAWPALRMLDGTLLEPGAAWRGEAIVLVLWATWCPFCKRHNEHVQALHRAVAGRPLRVLGASLDKDPAQVRRHVQERGYGFPVTLDGALLRERFQLPKTIPVTATFDRLGRLVQRIPGEMFEEDVLALARLADGSTTGA